MTFETFEDRYPSRSSIVLLAPKEDDDQTNVVVYFSDVEKFGKDQLTEIVKNLKIDSDKNNISLRHAIVVLKFDSKTVNNIEKFTTLVLVCTSLSSFSILSIFLSET